MRDMEGGRRKKVRKESIKEKEEGRIEEEYH